MRQIRQGKRGCATGFQTPAVWALAAVVAVAVCLPAGAETVTRKDGRKIQGQIVREDKESVTIQTAYGTFRIARDQIESISGRRAVSQNERDAQDALAAGDLDRALEKFQAALKETAKPDEQKEIQSSIAEVNKRIEEREEKRFASQLATVDRLIQEKKFSDAITELDNLARNNPDPLAAKLIQHRKGLLRMAEASYYMDQINYAEAADAYLKAIELMPDDPTPYLRMARLNQLRGGKDTDTIDYYNKGIERALKTRPEISLLNEYYELGKSFLRAATASKEPSALLMEGIKSLLIVSRDGATSFPFAADKLEEAFAALGKTSYDSDAVVKMLQSTLEINPNAQKARWILAEVYTKKREYDKAIKELLKIESDARATGQAIPEELYYRLGLCYLAIVPPDRDKALTAFENEIRVNKLNYMALIRAAELHTAKGTYDDALDYCNQAIALRKERPEAYLVAGEAYMRRSTLGDLQEARRYLNLALGVKSDFQPARIKLAEIEIVQQRRTEAPNYDSARAYLLQAMQGLVSAQKGPPTEEDKRTKAEAILWMAEIENDVKNPREALNIVKSAIAENPNFSRAYRVQGQIQVNLQFYEDAKKSYSRAIELDPSTPDTYMLMGLLCQNYLKNFSEAIKYYNQYLQYGGTNAPDAERVARWIAECERSGGLAPSGTTPTTGTLTGEKGTTATANIP